MVKLRDRDPYVVVCVPNQGTWTEETSTSMVLMFSYFALNRIPGVDSQRMGIISIQGSMLSQQRHLCVSKACQTKRATHLAFIDSDMKFPRDTIHRLIQHDKDFVACNCTTRKDPIVPVAFDFDGNRISSVGRTGIEKVRQVGLAVSLLRLDALRKIRPPHFMQEWIPEAGYYCGEDVYFCQLAQASNLDIWVEHDLSREIKHIGSREWGYDDISPEGVEAITGPITITREGVMP